MTAVDVQPADIVEATVNACKRVAIGVKGTRLLLIPPAAWDLSYKTILEEAQKIADGRVRDIPG